MEIKTNNQEKNNMAIMALYNVIDPEIELNIIDLGLIYEINFNEESKAINVCMTLTTQFCPMGESIVASATQALEQVFSEYEIQVALTFDPAWNQSMISDQGRVFLNK